MALKKLVSDLTQGLTAYPNHNTPSDSGGFNYGSSTSLFDTQTFNQRSLGYTNPLSRQDNPEPLIPQILPGVNQEPEGSILFIDDSPDGFIRGGAENAQKRSTYDGIRINRFFETGEGITFISLQKSLQKSNPIIQEGGGNLNNTFEDLLNSAIGTNFTNANTNRVFNEENLIKQVKEGGYTGNYFNRAGSNPEIQSRPENKYEAIHKPGRKFDGNQIGDFNTQGGLTSGNRLISLGKKLAVGTGISFNLTGQDSLMKQAVKFDVGEAMDVFKDLKNGFNNLFNNPLEALSQPGPFSENPNIGFQPGENIIYQYSGGPGSTYGIGDTILYRYQRTSGDFDHQGHPLSFNSYFANQITTVGSNNISFYKDGQFDTSAGLDFLAGTVNENLFGGNNILGSGGLLFDDDFNFNPLDNIVEGLGNQLFGEDTVNFVKDIFDGGGIGNPKPGIGEQIPAGSYLLGGFNTVGGLYNGYLETDIFLDNQPKPGFIESKRSPSGDGYKNKPDDIAADLEEGKEPSAGIGRIVTFQNVLDVTLDEDVYRPKKLKISKDGRKRLNEDGSDSNIQPGQSTQHYYSSILAKRVANKDSKSYIREERINTGHPGIYFAGKLTNDFTRGGGSLADRIDKLNGLDIHESDGSFTDQIYRDFIRFRFEAVNTEDPTKTEAMVFRAFLENFNDNYNANWNEFKYNGRGEPFYVYNSFKRSFDLSFKIAAQSRAEMKPLYRKLNYLATTLTPDYGDGGRMRGNYIKLTLGGIMDGVPGFLTTMGIKWMKDFPFEIAIGNPEETETDMHVLPHVLDVSCQFVPIHNFVPRKSVTDSPFFATSAGDDRGWYANGARSKSEAISEMESLRVPTVPTSLTGDFERDPVTRTSEEIFNTGDALNIFDNNIRGNFSNTTGIGSFEINPSLDLGINDQGINFDVNV